MKDTIGGRHCRAELGKKQKLCRSGGLVVGAIVLFDLIVGVGCISRRAEEPKKRIEPVYDQATGKLKQLQYDSDGDGRIDTWCFMDGSRVVRIEVDENEDGKIDRWEHYDVLGHLEKTGFSRSGDGFEDAWSYSNSDGSIDRVEISTKHDSRVTRIERYRNGVLASAEEDTDGDGKVDRWETYDGDRLTSVAYDTRHLGVPDRRIVYDPDHGARVEVAEKGDGRFVAAPTVSHIPDAPK
jgi:hypothetical protein